MQEIRLSCATPVAGAGARYGEPLVLARADRRERERIIGLAAREGRQTMSLRTMPGAQVVVLRRPDGLFAGWAGADIESDPEHPELFSQFVYPAFRGRGLGGLLELFWWTYLDSAGCATGFMRMEFDTNEALLCHRLASRYYRQVLPAELGPRFVSGCHRCELYGNACRRQVYLAVDIAQALAAGRRAWGHLDLDDLPWKIDAQQTVLPPAPVTREERVVRI